MIKKIGSALALLVLTVSLASAQTVFVGDLGQGNVYKITPNGSLNTFATNLGSLQGLTLDQSGNLYVAAFNQGRVFKFTPSGKKSLVANVPAPVDLAFDPAGNLFVTTVDLPRSTSGALYKIPASGQPSIFATLTSAPRGVASDTAGNVYVTTSRGQILRYTPEGASSLFASGIVTPGHPAFDSQGNLFVPSADGSIYKFTPEGTQSTFATGLGNPYAVAFGARGNLLVSDFDGAALYSFGPGQESEVVADGFMNPVGIATRSR